ncbi:CES5A.2 family protein [Megaselia abdita]
MTWLRRFFVAAVFVSLVSASTKIPLDKDLVVELKNGGSLIGTVLNSFSGRRIRSFLGVPYAKPPIGELRFKPPVPFPPWQGIINATESGSLCYQLDFIGDHFSGPPIGSEDCLFLNIYTPPLERLPKTGFPVMVHIHGGGWLGGTNNHQEVSPAYIMDEDVILVNINYRVGIFGFLSSESLECPGNYGLKDQVESLRWIKEHISVFGGDPNTVTIFGESAGAASVSYLLESEKSKGLFHRAIMQSGIFFNPWAQPLHKGVARKRALKVAEWVNCGNEKGNWAEIVSCLKQVDGYDLVRKSNKLTEWNGYPFFIFQPTIEPSHPEAFLDKHPRKDALNSLDIPILTGITTGEGIMSSVPILSNEKLLRDVKEDVENKFPLMLGYDHLDKDQQKDVTRELERFYLKNGHHYNKFDHQNFTDIFSDALFLHGFDEYLEKRPSLNSAPTYVYVFDMATNNSFSKKIGGGDRYYGVSHGDDKQFFIPIQKLESSLRGNSLVMKSALVKLLVNFASYGNPTPNASGFRKWEPVTKKPWNFVRMGVTNDQGFHVFLNEQNYERDRFNFWKSLFAHIDK